MHQNFCIGIDFDNTLIDYSSVLLQEARKQGLIQEQELKTKKQIRDVIRDLPNGNTIWTQLQSRIYGELIVVSPVMEGALAFIQSCCRQKIPVFIISHKTQYATADPQGNDLRKMALSWLEQQGFFNPAYSCLKPQDVFFHDTQDEKIQRISELACTHFIDDLEEVLTHPQFPKTVERFLLTQGVPSSPDFDYPTYNAWKDIERAIFKN